MEATVTISLDEYNRLINENKKLTSMVRDLEDELFKNYIKQTNDKETTISTKGY
jgi:hypothetical protein